MKWFKHMTNSSLDERLARFTDKYGLEAYGFFWRVLEAIAENVDETNRKHIEYSTKTWCKLLGIRPQTFRKLIQESSVLGLFQVSFNSDLVSVESPNILKYRDEWTRKKSRTPEQNSEKDKEKETEKEEENTVGPKDGPPPQRGFSGFTIYHQAGAMHISQRDFDSWERAYTNIDLRAELQKLSDWTKTTREWGKKEAFHACSAALAKKNGAAFEAHREQSRPSAMCAVN